MAIRFPFSAPIVVAETSSPRRPTISRSRRGRAVRRAGAPRSILPHGRTPSNGPLSRDDVNAGAATMAVVELTPMRAKAASTRSRAKRLAGFAGERGGQAVDTLAQRRRRLSGQYAAGECDAEDGDEDDARPPGAHLQLEKVRMSSPRFRDC